MTADAELGTRPVLPVKISNYARAQTTVIFAQSGKQDPPQTHLLGTTGAQHERSSPQRAEECQVMSQITHPAAGRRAGLVERLTLTRIPTQRDRAARARRKAMLHPRREAIQRSGQFGAASMEAVSLCSALTGRVLTEGKI